MCLKIVDTFRAVLTDNGEEYRGEEGEHPYELFLALNDIDHRFTKVGTPRTNSFVERFNRTVLDEFFREAFRKKFYGSVDELQADLDKWVNHYNNVRLHQAIGYVTPQVKHMGLEEVVFEARRSSLARAREERIDYKKEIKITGSDEEWSARQEAETVTLVEPIFRGGCDATRPGEKMNERLVFKVEEMLPTPHPKINRVVHDYELPDDFDVQDEALIERAARDDGEEIIRRLSQLLPSCEANKRTASTATTESWDNAQRLRLV